MRKFGIILVAVLVLALVGCGPTEPAPAATAQPGVTATGSATRDQGPATGGATRTQGTATGGATRVQGPATPAATQAK